MSWPGIQAKLARVGELASEIKEISVQVLAGAEPVKIESPNPEDAAAMAERLRALTVPLRLSVLTGEGLYHLRSSLDQLVCDLIREEGNEPGRRAQFPIFETEPVSHDERKSFARCVKGIDRPEVVDAIRAWQPYRNIREGIMKTGPFLALQALNNFDKHNALHLTTAVVHPRVRARVDFGVAAYSVDADDDGDDTALDREIARFGVGGPVVKVRRIQAAIVIDHPAAANQEPHEVLEASGWRVREVMRDMGRFFKDE